MSFLRLIERPFWPLKPASGTLIPEATLTVINAANPMLNERLINFGREVKGFRLLQKLLTPVFTLLFLF